MLCVHDYIFAKFRKLVEMLLNCTLAIIATGGSGDKSTLPILDLDY